MSMPSNSASMSQATRLDAITGHFDPWLLGASIALACLGIVMVASSSIAIGEGLDVQVLVYDIATSLPPEE